MPMMHQAAQRQQKQLQAQPAPPLPLRRPRRRITRCCSTSCAATLWLRQVFWYGFCREDEQISCGLLQGKPPLLLNCPQEAAAALYCGQQQVLGQRPDLAAFQER